jgi:hypothetical protein
MSDIRPVDRIGSYWENPKTRTFAELGIDQEDGTLRAVLIGMLREAGLNPAPHEEPVN